MPKNLGCAPPCERGGSQCRQLPGQRRLSTPLRGESDWSRRTGANIAPMDLTILRHRVPSRRRVHRTVAADRSSWESNVPLVGQALAADGEALFREDGDAIRRLQLRLRFPERTCQPNVPYLSEPRRIAQNSSVRDCGTQSEIWRASRSRMSQATHSEFEQWHLYTATFPRPPHAIGTPFAESLMLCDQIGGSPCRLLCGG
jgi:hypothetical protein